MIGTTNTTDQKTKVRFKGEHLYRIHPTAGCIYGLMLKLRHRIQVEFKLPRTMDVTVGADLHPSQYKKQLESELPANCEYIKARTGLSEGDNKIVTLHYYEPVTDIVDVKLQEHEGKLISRVIKAEQYPEVIGEPLPCHLNYELA